MKRNMSGGGHVVTRHMSEAEIAEMEERKSKRLPYKVMRGDVVLAQASSMQVAEKALASFPGAKVVRR